MELSDRIAACLAPHLGATTADAVARHLCAKHRVDGESADPEKLEALRDTIRRGLVPFVGTGVAEDVARRCF